MKRLVIFLLSPLVFAGPFLLPCAILWWCDEPPDAEWWIIFPAILIGFGWPGFTVALMIELDRRRERKRHGCGLHKGEGKK